MGTYQAFNDADAYLYLVINNDWLATPNYGRDVLVNPANKLPRLVTYLQFLFLRKPSEQEGAFGAVDIGNTYGRFINDISTLAQEDSMVFMAFAGDDIGDIIVEAGHEIVWLAQYPSEHRISFVDVHLNETGNEILADMIAPILERAIADNCG